MQPAVRVNMLKFFLLLALVAQIHGHRDLPSGGCSTSNHPTSNFDRRSGMTAFLGVFNIYLQKERYRGLSACTLPGIYDNTYLLLAPTACAT